MQKKRAEFWTFSKEKPPSEIVALEFLAKNNVNEGLCDNFQIKPP